MSYTEATAISGQDTNEFFGKALSVYGDKVAVAQNGKVNVYTNTAGTSAWKIDNTDLIVGNSNLFGSNIELSEDRLAVANGQGTVTIYRYNELAVGGPAWEPKTGGVVTGNSDQFGSTMKFVNPDLILIGDSKDSSTVVGGGLVCSYNIAINPATCTNEITAPDVQKNDRFGEEIAINGSYIAVGCPGRKVRSKSNVGSVFVYDINNLSNLIQTIEPERPVLDGRFGSSIDINNNDDMVISSPNEKIKMFKSTGKVFIYQGGGSWTLTKSLSPDRTKLYGHFGKSVKIQDNGVAYIGQPGYDVPSHNQGRIFKYGNVLTSDAYETLNLSGNHPSSLLGQTFEIVDEIEEDIVIGIPNFGSSEKPFHGITILFKSDSENVFFGESEVFFGTEEVIFTI